MILRKLTGTLLLLCTLQISQAQILKKVVKSAKQASERTIENRAAREASQRTDKAIDDAIGTKKDKRKKKGDQAKNTEIGKTKSDGNTNRTINANSDFQPGTKLLAEDNFNADPLNDFPLHWNTNASGKVVTISGSDKKWMELTTKGAFLFEKINKLPDNFTVEFELFVTPNYTFYDAPLVIALANMKNQKDFSIWEIYRENRGKEKRDGFRLELHPQGAGSNKLGYSNYEVWENGSKASDNKMEGLKPFNVNNPSVKVQIWKQNQRMRVYINGDKIWDVPRAFDKGKTLNSFILARFESKSDRLFYVTNFKFLGSEEDIRSKLLNEGAYSTNAILFNTGSAELKQESMSIIQSVADVLKENTRLTIKITGHTDSDGNPASNLKLSKDRAQSVKNALVNQNAISASRIITDGKGDTEPVASNSTADGKAQNRRVEFEVVK